MTTDSPRLPSLGPWPERVHATVERDARQRSTTSLFRHRLGLDPHATLVDGVLVSSLVRTIIDVSRSTSFVRAVAMVDQGLRGLVSDEFTRRPLDRSDLLTAAASVPGRAGSSRALRAIAFGDGLSANAGESLCRVQLRALGLPAPRLQVRFVDDQGAMFPDFYFEEFDLAVEFDGAGKYLRDREFRPELTAAQIVLAEKRRENRLRRQVRDVARIEWADAWDRRRLASILRQHGVPV